MSGFPEKIEDARTNLAEFEFDFLGRITKTTDRTLRDWEDTFDLRGNRLSSKDPQSNTIRYCYDQNDNLTLVVPARAGQAPVCNAAGEDTDVNGGVLDGTDGYSTKLTYDPRDLPETTLATSLSTASPENLESAGAKKTEFEYYADGQLKIVREPRRFNASSGAPLTGNDFEVMQETLYEYYWNNRLKKVLELTRFSGRSTVGCLRS